MPQFDFKIRGRMKNPLGYVLVAILSVSCSKKDSATGDTSDDTSVTALMQSAASTVGGALQGSATSLVETSRAQELPSMLTAACSTVPFGSCSGGVFTRNFNGCTRTSSAGAVVNLYGVVSWTVAGGCGSFDFTGTNLGTATRTISGGYSENTVSGYKVIEYTSAETIAGQTFTSSDLNAYTGTTYSGGTTVDITGANTRTVNVLGVHRRGLRSDGVLTFWHTLFTPSALAVTESGGNFTISSGVITIFHNRAGISVTNTLSGVSYPTDGSCCYPTAGTITTTIGTGTPVITSFSATCGSVTVGSTAATLAPCGGN